jgi:hypothetical protein
VKRGGSLSFLVGTIGNVLVMEIGWGEDTIQNTKDLTSNSNKNLRCILGQGVMVRIS